MELARIAGLTHLGGQDIRHAGSLYSFTSSEASIFRACVKVLKAIYDDPLSPEGIALDNYLTYLETRWDLGQYATKHREAYDDIDRSSNEFY